MHLKGFAGISSTGQPVHNQNACSSTSVETDWKHRMEHKGVQKLPALIPSKYQQANILPQPMPANRFSLLTHVSVDRLAFYLSGYAKQSTLALTKGFSCGFSLRATCHIPPLQSPNHTSVNAHLDFVRIKIEKEVQLHRVKRPYNSPPLHCSIALPLE